MKKKKHIFDKSGIPDESDKTCKTCNNSTFTSGIACDTCRNYDHYAKHSEAEFIDLYLQKNNIKL